MSSQHGASARTGSERAIDSEHHVQIELVDAVVDAVGRGDPPERVAEVLDHFIEFSELHFRSEALLMRLHDYPDYDEHVTDHEHLIDRMHALRDRFSADSRMLDARRAARLKGEILSHIRNRDAALHVFIARQRG